MFAPAANDPLFVPDIEAAPFRVSQEMFDVAVQLRVPVPVLSTATD